MTTKYVVVKISTNEIGVHVVDFPKNPFDDSRDTPQTALCSSRD